MFCNEPPGVYIFGSVLDTLWVALATNIIDWYRRWVNVDYCTVVGYWTLLGLGHCLFVFLRIKGIIVC